MKMENDLSKQKIINIIDDKVNKSEHIRSELFSLYQMEYSLIVGILIGVSGGILGNFIYNMFDKNSLIYWLFFLLIIFLFLKSAKKAYNKIKYINGLYTKNDDIFKELTKAKDKSESILD